MASQKASNVPLAPIDPLGRYSIDESCRHLKQSRAQTYKDIAAGRLKTIREGARQFVPASEIIRRSTLQVASASA